MEYQKRETEKRTIRKELLASWLHRKQLEEEVMTDMVLQRGKTSLPTHGRSDKISSDDQRRELEKRLIREELYKNWLYRKQLEEEVMTELCGEELALQMGNDSLKSNHPEVTIFPSDKARIDMPCPLIQSTSGNYSRVPYIYGHLGQDLHMKTWGNHSESGVTDYLPFQRHPGAPIKHPEAPNSTKVKACIGWAKGASAPLVRENQECASQKEDKVDMPLLGGNDKTTDIHETATNTNKKRKQWVCDICHVKGNSEDVLTQHFNGRKHLAKQKSLSKTAEPLSSNPTEKSIPVEEDATKQNQKMANFITTSEETLRNHDRRSAPSQMH